MADMVEVTKTAKCNRCGDEQVAWVQGKKSGKWYLATAHKSGDAILVNRFDFHECNPALKAAYENSVQSKVVTKKSGKKPQHFPNIPKGRYALVNGSTNIVEFFQVDQPEEGTKWFGWTFVKKLLGSPGDYNKTPLRGSDALNVLTAIAANPQEAMQRYGHESGVCGNCSSPLSDPESLQRGLGPICASNLGWKNDESIKASSNPNASVVTIAKPVVVQGPTGSAVVEAVNV